MANKVNPKELADQLRREGVSLIIEFIQPDFPMYMENQKEDGSADNGGNSTVGASTNKC